MLEKSSQSPAALDVASRQAMSSIGILVGFAGGRVSQVAAHVVIARALGGEAFGLYALGWTILHLGQAIGHLGLSEGVVRYLPRYRGKEPARVRSALARALGLSLFAGGLLSVVLLLASKALAEWIFDKPGLAGVLFAFAPALAVAPVMQVAAAATRATMMMRHSIVTVDAGLPILLLLVAVGIWWAGGSAVAMALATSLILVVVAVLAIAQACWLYRDDLSAPRVLRPEPDRLVPFSLLALFGTSTLLVMLWSDRLFVGAFRPAAEVGAYHAASQISMLLVIVFQPLAAVLAPFAATAVWKDRRDDLERVYQNVYRWGLYVAAPAAVLTLEFADLVLVFAYGPEFAAATPSARVLIAGQLVYLVGGAAGALLVMTGHERLWLVHSSLAVVVNLALNALLVPRYGMLGAAVSTAVGLLVLQGGGCLVVRQALGMWPLTRPVAIALLAGVSSSGLALIVIHAALGVTSGPLRALPPAAGILVIFSVLIRTKAHREDREILLELSRRLTRAVNGH